MIFEEAYNQYLMEQEKNGDHEFDKLFGGLATADEIIEKMMELTMRDLMMDQTCISHRFAVARMKYLAEVRDVDFQTMFLDKTLLDHLLHIEKQARRLIDMERPKMMEKWNIQEEIKKDFLKGVGLKENMEDTLIQIAMEEYVYV